jgi:flagellar biosynthetic protein FliQ
MDPIDAIDLAREAVVVALLVSAPLLIVGMLVGLGIGLIQALTQVQEQTVAFVPKIVAMMLTLSLSLPWVLQKMIEYTRDLILEIPQNL